MLIGCGWVLAIRCCAQFYLQALNLGTPTDTTGPAAAVASVWQISGDDFGDDMVGLCF